ncbi:SipW-dependent-type signal peptide-containing protein [Natronoarchaeum sp. GCM10025703]|uniref:SipW-dependent-type signal peptide-containing protein n=1 Tax=unclassified Natronoarchaeum TaxID=2620183 RepID=UPI0036087C33
MADENSGRLNRRSVLAGIGAAGTGAALGGLGTSALFTDDNHLNDNEIVAGELDLFVDWQEAYDMGDGLKLIDVFPDAHPTDGTQDDLKKGICEHEKYELSDFEDPLNSSKRSIIDYHSRDITSGDNSNEPLVHLDDVKPGDCWETTLSYHLCGNDGWVWFRTKNLRFEDKNADNKPTDHLADKAEARVWYDMYEGMYPPTNGAGSVSGEIGEGTSGIDEIITTGSDDRFGQAARNYNCDDYEERLEQFAEGDLDGDEYFGEEFEEETSVNGPCGEITVNSRDTNDGSVTLSSDGPVVIVSVKGGDEGEQVYVFEVPVILDEATFSTPTGQGISNIDVCCLENGDNGGNGEMVEPGDNVYQYGKEPVIAEGTLREVLEELEGGALLDGDLDSDDPACTTASNTYYIGFEWCLPKEVGNEVQQDRLEFDFGFYTEQCRHNDDPSNPF